MQKNIGGADRVIRLVLGAGLIVLTVYWKCIFCAIAAAILILTAAIGWCGLYKILGINTCKIKK